MASTSKGTKTPAAGGSFDSVAEAYLCLLKARGVDWLFANAGTDFAPIIEALTKGNDDGRAMPEAVAITHENVAVGMAHGYYLVTGRPQAVMFHVNVGTANALMGLINAARDNIPMLFTSGRTPITEGGRLGARDLPIHWGQEMFDQAGMLREVVKWDYELRYGEQVEAVVDRALATAMSEPKGPVYLSLPREALAEPFEGAAIQAETTMPAPAASAPNAEAIDQALALLENADRPLAIVGRGSAGTFQPLEALAERFAMPVAHFWASRIGMASDHPLHAGFDVAGWIEEADVILTIDSMVPWIPDRHRLSPGCRIIQLGADPYFGNLPMRSFPAALAIAADPAKALQAMAERSDGPMSSASATRRAELIERIQSARAARLEQAEAGRATPMSASWISHCLDRAKPDDAIVVSELGVDVGAMTFRRPDSLMSHSLAGGLGWGVPAAFGAKLASPDRLVIAAVGDGSYMFANPTACHHVAEALDIPLLTIVFNNGVWNAVRKSTLAVYPDGDASRANRMPLSSLSPAPDYEKLVEASRGHGERIEDPDALPDALERAVSMVMNERRQVLLNVVCAIDG
ncbi:MAG: thiamine pyrophosphate-requiring protein [Alphaproteobacteria bacterium]|nr:thiamine pyrophosphate-requiring protein [Alphaproteobacteria bacterium]